MFHALHDNQLPFINGGEGIDWVPDISTFASLAVIILSMAVATIASLVKMRIDARRGVSSKTTANAAPDEQPGINSDPRG